MYLSFVLKSYQFGIWSFLRITACAGHGKNTTVGLGSAGPGRVGREGGTGFGGARSGPGLGGAGTPWSGGPVPPGRAGAPVGRRRPLPALLHQEGGTPGTGHRACLGVVSAGLGGAGAGRTGRGAGAGFLEGPGL